MSAYLEDQRRQFDYIQKQKAIQHNLVNINCLILTYLHSVVIVYVDIYIYIYIDICQFNTNAKSRATKK